MKELIIKLLTSEFALSLAAMLIGMLWLRIKAKVIKAAGWKESVLLAIEGAVTATYHDYVQELKKKNEDGKLTQEEKSTALSTAVNKVKDALKEKGIDLAKEYSDDILRALIEKAVSANKK